MWGCLTMKWIDPFKGKTTREISESSISDVNSWDRRTAARAVRRLADTANKRIKQFQEAGIEPPAYLNVMKSGGKFSTRGKDVNQLRSEFIRARNFLNMKTSTKRGYEKVKKDFFDRVNATAAQRISLSDEALNKFWRVYDKTESDISPFVKGSERGQKIVFDVFIKDTELTEKELIKKVLEKFDIYYEEKQQEEEYFNASDFFSIKG